MKEVPKFWIGLALILILSAVPLLLSYDFSLPYIDHPDEPDYYWNARQVLDPEVKVTPQVFRLPVYRLISAGVQWLAASAGVTEIGEVMRYLRLASVTFNLATLVVVGLTARLVGDDITGWIAAAVWGFSSGVLGEGIYALPDSLLALESSLALWLATAALVDEKKRYLAVWSVAAGASCIVTKYHPVSAVVPGILGALVYFVRDRRTNFRYLLYQAALLIPTAAYVGYELWDILFLNDPYNEGATFKSQGLQNLVDPGLVWANLSTALAQVSLIPFLIVCVLGAGALVLAYVRKAKRIRADLAGLCLFMVVSVPWVVSTFRVGEVRDVLSAVAAAAVVLGAAVTQMMHLVPEQWPRPIQAGLTLALVLPVLVPQFQQDWQIVQDRQLPDLRVDMRMWADVSLEPGTVIVTAENHKLFNPGYSGLQGRYWFDWWETENITEHSVAEWRDERGMSYAALTIWDIQDLEATEEGRAYLAQMLRLRDFTAPPPHRGPDTVFFRLWRMEHETSIRFGDWITLRGYDQDATEVAPGGAVAFRFYWNAFATPPDNYSLFIHLMPVDRVEVLSQADGNPAQPERLTVTWDEPSETLISPPFVLSIPADLAMGEYRVLIGLYNYETGVRLPVTDEATGQPLGDSFELATLMVAP